MTNAPRGPRRPPSSPGRRHVAAGGHFAFELETRKALGQHFLRDEGVIARIAAEAEASLPVGAGRSALEIGPGSGALTKALLAREWTLRAVEKDARAAEGLRAHLAPAHPGRLVVEEGDVLRYVPPAGEGGAKTLCVGNLPYYITSDILFWFLSHAGAFHAALFMVQDEVADRLSAPPGTKDYGRLTVRMQLSCEVEKVIFVPASAFSPPPKVHSAVVRLVPKPSPFGDAAEERRFGEFTALLFSARRKMMRRVLTGELGTRDEGSRGAFWQEAARVGVVEETRPDATAPEAILALFRALRGAR